MSLEGVNNLIDDRQRQLENWLSGHIGENLQGVPAGSDAGFRRYFRYQLQDQSVIAMDSPPQLLDCEPFVRIAKQLRDAGISAPAVLAQDIEQGFLLLSDLGVDTYLDAMNRPGFSMADADNLFTDAIDTLIIMQQRCDTAALPVYDEAFLRRELELFPEWYLQGHLGLSIDTNLHACLQRLFNRLIEQILTQQKVFMHRDYMPRNLMMPRDVRASGIESSTDNSDARIGVLDFQDAVCGPVSYDLASLFRDAFISWPQEKVTEWTFNYWQKAIDAKLPVPPQFEDFERDCDYAVTQRHLKIMGIFSRINYRDGKPRYLQDMPRFVNYLSSVAKRRSELTELGELLAYLNASVVKAQ